MAHFVFYSINKSTTVVLTILRKNNILKGITLIYFWILLAKVIFKSIFCFKYFFQVFVCKMALILYIQSIIFFPLKPKFNKFLVQV